MVAHGGSETIRIGELVEGTEERGFYLLMILLSLPFVLPIPLPALSNVWGLAVVVISFRLAWRLPPRLPSFLAKREISRQRVEAFLRKTGSSLQVIEKLVKPRVGNWMTWPPARFANAMLLAFNGVPAGDTVARRASLYAFITLLEHHHYRSCDDGKGWRPDLDRLPPWIRHICLHGFLYGLSCSWNSQTVQHQHVADFT
jgi:Exopolysaccharide synthesis, ExoD